MDRRQRVAAAVADADRPETAEEAIRHELAVLWCRLEWAVRDAANGVWSCACDGLVHSIVALSRVVGPCRLSELPVSLVESGLCAEVHQAAGITTEAPVGGPVGERRSGRWSARSAGSVPVSLSATGQDRSYLRSRAETNTGTDHSDVPAQKSDTVRDGRPNLYGMLNTLLDTVEAHAGETPNRQLLLQIVMRDRDLLAAAAVYRMRAAPLPDGGDLGARLRAAVSAATLDDEINRAVQFWDWLVEHQEIRSGAGGG